MEIDTLKAFTVGMALGSMVGGYVGYNYGRKAAARSIETPGLRVLIAMVIVAIWGLAQLFSLAFGTSVDGWLNAIMGMVAGFFFGDGLVETVRGGKKKVVYEYPNTQRKTLGNTWCDIRGHRIPHSLSTA